ncbi:MAG: hypothetical protein ND866_20840 [Pyrinomonadaceae bacterium]|nr:hypothetical protein [Pyrinomonadaceae bacterium]
MQVTVEPKLNDIAPPSINDGGQAGLRLVNPAPKQPTLESQIDLILGNTDYLLPILKAVRQIFNDLVRLLDCLRLMEGNLHQVSETLALLEIVQADTLSLLDFTEKEALQTDGISERLYEVLDGMSFALRHEVRRVFEEDLQLSGEEPHEIAQAKITDAHRILTNCLQQSIITLAQVFDPRLDGRQLFDNSKARLKQSLLLCKDLWTMINLVRRAERGFDRNLINRVMERVQAFRNGSMHYLMYRDWGHFERIVEQLEASLRGELDSGPVLHQFLCYLETLLGQVKLRAVLAEMMPDFFCNQIGNKETELDWTTDELRLAYELYMAG